MKSRHRLGAYVTHAPEKIHYLTYLDASTSNIVLILSQFAFIRLLLIMQHINFTSDIDSKHGLLLLHHSFI